MMEATQLFFNKITRLHFDVAFQILQFRLAASSSTSYALVILIFEFAVLFMSPRYAYVFPFPENSLHFPTGQAFLFLKLSSDPSSYQMSAMIHPLLVTASFTRGLTLQFLIWVPQIPAIILNSSFSMYNEAL